jgi:hypothetical protein
LALPANAFSHSLDPDGTSVWIAHAFAVPSGYQMIVGKVTP